MTIIVLNDIKRKENYRLDVPGPMKDLGVENILQSALTTFIEQLDLLPSPPDPPPPELPHLKLNRKTIIEGFLNQLVTDLHHLYAIILSPIELPEQSTKKGYFGVFNKASKLPSYTTLLSHPAYKPYITRIRKEGDQLIRQNIAADIESLQRIRKDFDEIRSSFFPHILGSITLDCIQSMESDRHHDGRVVKKLTFLDQKHSAHLIYKPTSVMVDAKLVGKTKGSTLPPSLLERMYSLIDPAELSPPVYTILPKSGYGYMEYLGDHCSLHDAAHAVLAGEESECITTAPKDIIRFSFDCGILYVLMVITGCADSHVENLIVHKKRPHLIDNEVLLSPIGPIGALLCLDMEVGSMSPSYPREKLKFYLNEVIKERYVDQKSVPLMGKNLLFLLEDNILTSLCINKERFLAGYRAALQVLLHPKILFWFERAELGETPIRFVPLKTAAFEYLRQWWLQASVAEQKNILERIKNQLKGARDMPSKQSFFSENSEHKESASTTINLLSHIQFDIALAIQRGDIPRLELNLSAKNELIDRYKMVINKLIYDAAFKRSFEELLNNTLNELANEAERTVITDIDRKPNHSVKPS